MTARPSPGPAGASAEPRPTPTTKTAGSRADQDAGHRATRFVPGTAHPGPPAPDDPALVVAGRRLLRGADGVFPRVADLPADTRWVPLGLLDGTPTWVTALPDSGEEHPGRWHSWRALAAEVPEPLAALAGRALQVVTWRRTHRFCGACTAELADVPGESARRCPDCDLYVPMQLSPAVLVAITRQGPAGAPVELLLVRHSYGPAELWALVAGFVEAGETLEAAVHREVGEEVGLEIGGLTYFGSQPWAMSGPGVLLAGFTATVTDGASGPIVDGRELVEARWFPLDGLPADLPPAYSISRWLIDAVTAAGNTSRRSGPHGIPAVAPGV